MPSISEDQAKKVLESHPISPLPSVSSEHL